MKWSTTYTVAVVMMSCVTAICIAAIIRVPENQLSKMIETIFDLMKWLVGSGFGMVAVKQGQKAISRSSENKYVKSNGGTTQ